MGYPNTDPEKVIYFIPLPIKSKLLPNTLFFISTTAISATSLKIDHKLSTTLAPPSV